MKADLAYAARPPGVLVLRRLLADDAAQGVAEYAFIIALVALVCIAALQAIGKKVSNSLSNAARLLN